MKKLYFLTILLLVLTSSFLIGGCSSIEEYPRYDRVLTYDRPYDFTYLRVLEALNSYPNWVLEETDKEKGIIAIRNTEYGHLFDRDKNLARFIVKRVARSQTSIELDSETQQVGKGGEMLERIDQYMKRG